MIVLPVPPSTNHLFFNVKGRGRVRSTEYTNWASRAAAHLLAQRPAVTNGNVSIVIRIPHKTRGDLDNRIKAPLDLLVTHGVIQDDRFVQSIHISRYPGEHMEMEVIAA